MKNNTTFAQDVLTLASVPVISQIIGLLLTPIVTRLYPPEAFGLANVFGSVVMLLAVFSTMGYHGAIILPKHDKTALIILLVCFIAMLGISAFSFLIVTVGRDIIPTKLNAPDISKFLWLTPIFVFLHGMSQTLRFWKTRVRNFGNLSVSRVSEIVARKSVQIPAGFLGFATTGSLIFADLTATIVKNIILLRNMDLKIISLKKKSYLNLWAVARRYRKFPLFSVWGELFSRLPAVIVSFLIIKYFGQDMLGNYVLCLIVLTMPHTLIMSSITEAFFPRVAAAKHEGKHVDLIEKIYERIFSLTVFPFIVLVIYGNTIFAVVFGSEWNTAGVFAQILSISIFVSIVFSTTSPIIITMERQELIPLNKLLGIVVIFVSYSIGIHYNNIYLALYIYTILSCVQIISIGIFVLKIIDLSILMLLKKIVYYVFICIILSGVLLYVKLFTNLSLFPLFFVIGLCTLIYYSLVLYNDNELRNILVASIKNFNLLKK